MPHAYSGPAAMPSAPSDPADDTTSSGDLGRAEIKDSPRHHDVTNIPPRPSPSNGRRHPPDVLHLHLPSPRSGPASNAKRGQYSRSISMGAGMARAVGSVTSHHQVDNNDIYAFCPLATSAGGIPTPRSQRLSESGLPGSRSFSSTIGIPAARPTVEPLKLGPLISAVACGNEEEIRDAVYCVRRALKGCPENKERLIRSGGIPFLVSLMKVPDPLTVEHAVTAIFNICRMEAGQKEIFSEGGLESLVDVLRAAENNEAARENAAAAIFCLANTEERKQLVTERGALPPLVGLLQTSSVRGQRDAILTIWSLVRWLCACSLYGFPGDTAAGDAGCHSEATAARAGAGAGASVAAAEVGAGGAGEGEEERSSDATEAADGSGGSRGGSRGDSGKESKEVNKEREEQDEEESEPVRKSVTVADFIATGAVPVLIGLLQSSDQGLEERSMAILSLLSKFPEGRRAIWEANGVEGVCDVLEMSSQRAKEEAVATLLRMAGSDTAVKAVLVREGVIPALYKIHKESEGNAGVKAKTLLDMLRTTWK
ncbi:unnamed protein product [Closterium sp. NIES-64]|nr:unnamed protein product [Closterium sp. NIES-65]CAI5952671.1 unnamed protein product [Closterium sp. NIES-64]